jgi:peptidoglycan glycosyltransferase
MSVLLLVAVAIFGIVFYIIRYAVSGEDWASAAFNHTVFRGGALSVGTLTDRGGVVLAGITDGRRTFADSADVRRATLHAVGDPHGNIGTGALIVYAPELMGYNFFTGAYSRTGAGRTVAHTIDSQLNVEAFRALDGRRGAVMVMNYLTGEVLCMVSNPSFDPGDPPRIIDGDPTFEGVFLNRAISSAYTPGSTFKLLTAAAAIENIRDVYDRVFVCEGSMRVGSDTVTCYRTHGELTFETALAVSCNIVFGELALELGSDTLAAYTERYGLSGRISVGRVLSARGNFDKAAPGTADLAWSGIGQHNNTVSPAAMLRFVGAIANGGVAADMVILERSGIPALISGGTRRVVRSDTAAMLGELMDHHSGGNFPGLQMHAKSGTAQVGGDRRPHAWFAGYIANEGFPLAFVVVVENGGGGTAVAGPVANRVLQAAVEM